MTQKSVVGRIGEIALCALPGLIFGALILARNLAANPANIRAGDLTDADSFMHLVRLRHVLASGGWDHGFLDRDNAPFGMVLHWTKAYDIIFATLAAPLALLTGWETALHVVSICWGPFCFALLILATIAAVRPVFDKTACSLAGLAVAMAPLIQQDSNIGDTDHHVLIAACWVTSLGLILRLVLVPENKRLGFLAGCVTAVTLWVTVECIFVLALGVTFLGLAWCRTGEAMRATCLRFAWGFCGLTIVLFALDIPYDGVLSPDLDRLSIVFVAFTVLLALLWTALAQVPQAPERKLVRFLAATIGATISGTIFLAIFSHILTPEQAVFIKSNGGPDWSASVAEMMPAYHEATTLVLTTSMPLLALLFAIGEAWQNRHRPAGLAWLAYVLVMLPLLAVGLLHLRFMTYPEIMASLGIAKLAGSVGSLQPKLTARGRWLATHLMAIFLVAILPGFAARAVSSPEPAAGTSSTAAQNRDCRAQTIAAALNDKTFMGGDNLILMTTMNLAPDILYWSNHRVVAGPYHRNVDGIKDELRFFATEDDDTAKSILARRGISFVLACPEELRVAFATAQNPHNIAARLLNGSLPSWLQPQVWPRNTKTDTRLFRVRSQENINQ